MNSGRLLVLRMGACFDVWLLLKEEQLSYSLRVYSHRRIIYLPQCSNQLGDVSGKKCIKSARLLSPV